MPGGARGEPPGLLDRLRDEIVRTGPITFARFMELALHDPRQGYYARGPARLGTGGDFFTASDVGPAFGHCIARQLIEIDRKLGPFAPFDVLEFGSGRGLLARDVLDALARTDAALARRVRYRMIDRSEAMREAAQRLAPEGRAVSPDEVGGGHRGCILAVELFDALPVHRVRRRNGRLIEIGISCDAEGRLAECEIEPGDDVRAWAERYGAAAEEGIEAEVAPSIAGQVARMDRALDNGAWIVVDYGDRSADLYVPARRRGTLLAYHEHATSEDYLARVGEQDLTAHVNFSAIEDEASRRGIDVLGLTTQDRFLVANGILEAFDQDDPAASYDPKRVKERMQAMQLIHPMGMGRTFKVMLLAKGCPRAPALDGLRDPFSRS